MNEELQKYLDDMIKDCLTAVPSLSKEKLADYFNLIILDTLIYSLTDEQIKEIKDLNFNDPAQVQQLQLMAASIPGFIFIVDDVLKQEVAQIKKTGQIPSTET